MSSKAVEAYRLHPSRLKTLAPRGQGYLFYMGSEPAEPRWWWPFGRAMPSQGNGARPVNYAPLPALRQDWSGELPRKEQGRGLRLYERFVKG